MATAEVALPPRHRSRWRRGLVFGAFAAVLAYYFYDMYRPGSPPPARSAADARMVAEVERLGGAVRSLGFSGGLLGFGQRETIGVTFADKRLDDAGLARLAAVATDAVSNITLYDTSVTDDGLRHLARFRNLRHLTLGSSRFPAGPNSSAPAANITDASLARLGELENLNWLDLRGTAVTGRDFDRLKGLQHLQSLTLTASQVTDEGLGNLAKALPGLPRLEINNAGIGDAGIKNLAPMRLKELSVSYTHGLTTATLKELEAMTSLRLLTAFDLGFHKEDFVGLRAANPDLRIHYAPAEVMEPASALRPGHGRGGPRP